MILRVTRKLAARIKVKLQAEPTPAENCFVDWSANLVEIRRKNYVLLTHTTTFYSVVFPLDRIGSAKAFSARVIQVLDEVLHHQKLGHVFDQLILPHLDPVVYAACQDRTVTGRMRQVLTVAKDLDDVALSKPFWSAAYLNSIVFEAETGRGPASAFTAAIPPHCRPGKDPDDGMSFPA